MQPIPANSTSSEPPPGSRRNSISWPKSRRRRTLFLCLYFAFLIGLAWTGNRLYWNLKFGVPLTQTADVWDLNYPELRKSGVLDAEIPFGDATLDVLMLGASTIEAGWGNIGTLLQEGLQRELGTPVRMFNLATVAHTSRDSALKSERLANKSFDLTIVYDGFNDCRMNNCRGDLFRDDYTHCGWYRNFERRRELGSITLPYELNATLKQLIELGPPETDQLQFGSELKTPGPFRRNLQSILDVARQQRGLVVLNTFAGHIPDNYTDEKLKNGQLDFGKEAYKDRCPLDMWGRKQDVIAALRAHNQIIRELARQNPNEVIFVDQEAELSSDGQNFADVCHFTSTGCQNFVSSLLKRALPRLREHRDRHVLGGISERN